MARTPIKRQAGPPGAGDGLELSTYVDQNGNLWVTGVIAITGITPSGGTLPVTISGTPTVTISGTPSTNILQVGGTAITLGQKAAAASLPVVFASNQSPIRLALSNIAAGTVPNNATSTAYEASRIAKAAPGVCYGMSGFNSKASAQFIGLFDASLVPANGAIPQVFLFVAAGSAFSFDFGSTGRAFYAGIVAANSSTGPTLTLGSADCFYDLQYI